MIKHTINEITSLPFTLLHLTPLHYISSHVFHFHHFYTFYHYTSIPSFHFTSGHFTSLHFNSLIITLPVLFLIECYLQAKFSSGSAGSLLKSLVVLSTKDYFKITILFPDPNSPIFRAQVPWSL